MKLRRNKLEPLRFDPSGAFIERHGVSKDQVLALAKELEPIRDAMIGSQLKIHSAEQPIPFAMPPRDAGFYALPSRLLIEYENDRRGSQLGRLFRVATHMHTIVDRIVVLGEESDAGARTLMQGCCQPYWNELSRGARGSKPRIYFAGNPTDNDAIQGLLHLLGVNEGRLASCETDRWGLVVIGKSGETLETATAFPQFLAALKRSCGGDEAKVSELLVPVTGKDGKLLAMAAELGCPETFAIPDDVGGPYSVLSAAGLVPAAMLGINVIELLQGALAMNDHFAKKPAEENIILQFVAVHHLLERQCGIDIRVMSLWSNALESVGSWYDQLSALSLGENETGFTSVSTVHSRDLHARLQKHRLGKRDKVVNHILVDGYRFDDLPIGHRTSEHDPHNAIGDITLPQIMRMEVQATNEALSSHGCPSTSLFLPRVDELHLGQLLQMLMITSSVEVRLREVNPHG